MRSCVDVFPWVEDVLYTQARRRLWERLHEAACVAPGNSFGIEVGLRGDDAGNKIGVDTVAGRRTLNQVTKGRLHRFDGCRGKDIFRFNGHHIVGGKFDKTAIQLQAVLVAEQLIPGDMESLAILQHKILGARLRNRREKQWQEECEILHAHRVASRSANCSIARATPFSSLVPVSCQPKFFNSGTPLPITTGIPANDSISRSLWLSPMAMTSSRLYPRSAAHSAKAVPFEQSGRITSIIAKS